jgi:hypothetical protein
MLWTVTVILLVLWALGLVSGSTMGAWVHILLVLAIISLIFAVMRRGAAGVP